MHLKGLKQCKERQLVKCSTQIGNFNCGLTNSEYFATLQVLRNQTRHKALIVGPQKEECVRERDLGRCGGDARGKSERRREKVASSPEGSCDGEGWGEREGRHSLSCSFVFVVCCLQVPGSHFSFCAALPGDFSDREERIRQSSSMDSLLFLLFPSFGPSQECLVFFTWRPQM